MSVFMGNVGQCDHCWLAKGAVAGNGGQIVDGVVVICALYLLLGEKQMREIVVRIKEPRKLQPGDKCLFLRPALRQ